MKVKVTKADATNAKFRDLLENDINSFLRQVQRGYGWILKGDIVQQFHDFTNGIWRDPLLEREMLAKEIVKISVANSSKFSVEVFDTLTAARKHGHDFDE